MGKGDRFGRLVLVKLLRSDSTLNNNIWLCQCDCGNTKEAKHKYLREGKIKSCGCLFRTIKQEAYRRNHNEKSERNFNK